MNVLRKRRSGKEVTVRDIARIGRVMKGGFFARGEDAEAKNQEKPYESKTCGAKTRSGNPCKKWGMKPSGRCRLHGGKSTGPRTEEGKARIGASHLKHGRYTKEAIRERRLAREARDWWAFHWELLYDLPVKDPVNAKDYHTLWRRLCGDEMFHKHSQEKHIKQRFVRLLMRGDVPGVPLGEGVFNEEVEGPREPLRFHIEVVDPKKGTREVIR